LHLLQDILGLQDVVTLREIEILLRGTIESQGASCPSAQEFLGLWSKEDAEAIEKAIIKEGCE
jgi:hypothetical protein